MISHIIEGTFDRYCIREDGNIISNYRYKKNSIKSYNEKIITKYSNPKGSSSMVTLQCGKHSRTNKGKHFFVSTLMIKYFKLTPPDKFHKYRLAYKDSNILNNSLSNLYWEIFTEYDHEFKPVAFYDNYNNITAKKCCNCGEIKTIDNFHFQINSKTYRNYCELCRSHKRWVTITSDEEKLAVHKKNCSRYSLSEKGKSKNREWCQVYRDELGPSYIDYMLTRKGFAKNDITNELRDIMRLTTLLRRELRLCGLHAI